MEPHFYSFFDEQWKSRHYSKESAKTCDEIIKKASKLQTRRKTEVTGGSARAFIAQF